MSQPVHGRRATLRVDRLTVIGMMATAGRTTRHCEDDRRNDQTDGSNDNQDDPYCGKPEPVTLWSHRPVHDCTSRYCDGAESFLSDPYLVPPSRRTSDRSSASRISSVETLAPKVIGCQPISSRRDERNRRSPRPPGQRRVFRNRYT